MKPISTHIQKQNDIGILTKKGDLTFVVNALPHLGCECRPSYSTPDCLYFYLPDPAKRTRGYHPHLAYPERPIWEELVTLRDYRIIPFIKTKRYF